jgi:hypothetical protein
LHSTASTEAQQTRKRSLPQTPLATTQGTHDLSAAFSLSLSRARAHSFLLCSMYVWGV